MRAWRFVMIVGLCLTRTAPGQTAGGGVNRVGFTATLGRTQERDESISPLLYQGTVAGAALELERETARSRSRCELSSLWGRMAPAHPGSPTAFGPQTQARGELSHLRRLRESNDRRVALFAGGVLAGSGAIIQRRYVAGSDAQYARWLVGVGPAVQLEYGPSNGHALAYRISAPLLSGVVHPYTVVRPDNVGPNQLAWMGPRGYAAVDQRVDYLAALAPHVGLHTTLALELSSLTRAPRLRQQRESLRAGLVWWSRGPHQ